MLSYFGGPWGTIFGAIDDISDIIECLDSNSTSIDGKAESSIRQIVHKYDPAAGTATVLSSYSKEKFVHDTDTDSAEFTFGGVEPCSVGELWTLYIQLDSATAAEWDYLARRVYHAEMNFRCTDDMGRVPGDTGYIAAEAIRDFLYMELEAD